jgi:hypothetical protein
MRTAMSFFLNGFSARQSAPSCGSSWAPALPGAGRVAHRAARPVAPLGRTDLAVARERNLRLHDHAAPVMEMLHEQIVNTRAWWC